MPSRSTRPSSRARRITSSIPHWLVILERGLFTDIAIVGAVGSGKTASCIYPFAEQILAYRAHDPGRRIGGLILEVKGDFCGKVQEILARHGRAGDYVEISLESEYRYNPLHNDLDAYALAYNIASLLNNLFDRGKERFWQQAYTNLVKFIILLRSRLPNAARVTKATHSITHGSLSRRRLPSSRVRQIARRIPLSQPTKTIASSGIKTKPRGTRSPTSPGVEQPEWNRTNH